MEEYEKMLSEVMGKEEIEAEVKKQEERFAGLLTRETALFVIAKEKGLVKERFVKLAEVAKSLRTVNVRGRVLRVYPELKSERNGKEIRSVRVHLGDESGERTLVLWNEDVKRLVEICLDDVVEVRGTYVREEELHLGYRGELKVVERAPITNIDVLRENSIVNVIGKISEIFPEYFYLQNGKDEFMSSFEITNGSKKVRVVLWHEPALARELSVGSVVRLENTVYKNNELHVNRRSRVVVLKKEEDEGWVQEITVLGERELSARVGGNEVIFRGEMSLALLGLTKLGGDIGIGTALELQRGATEGRRAKVRIKKDGEKNIAEEIAWAS